MKRALLKAIPTKSELDVEVFNDLEIGVEIQDFVEPNLTKEQIEDTINFYMFNLGKLNGIKSLHGPFLDLKPASPDKIIRDVSYMRYLKALKIANQLDMDYIIFHTQMNPYLNQPYLKELNNLQAKEFWVKILDEVPDFKGCVLLENIFEETPDMLLELMETLNHPKIRVNLDIGHANLGRVHLEEWISKLKKYISYIHIHSNEGQFDTHNPPTDNKISEVKFLLDKYKLNPVLSLEYKVDDLRKEVYRYNNIL